MKPRLLTRTHYQIHEPAYLKVLILKCTSPSRSDYPERVADRFIGKIKPHKQLNLPAARYAIDLARGLGLLTDNLVWTDLGQLLNIVSCLSDERFDPSLSLPERLLFFRLFLEADGGALLFIARVGEEFGTLPPQGKTWINFVNQLFVDVYTKYLNLVSDPASRTRLRQGIERLRTHPYSGRSGEHQSNIHVNALYRMGFIAKADGRLRRYEIPRKTCNEPRPLQCLLEAVPDVIGLEKVIKDRTWPIVAERVFSDQLPTLLKEPAPSSPETFLHELRPIYDRVIASGVALCSLTTLIESIQIGQLSRGEWAITYNDAMELLRTIQYLHPRKVRFHVDRLGRPAFLKLADDFRP